MKDFNYEKWNDLYHNKEVVDLKKSLTSEEINLIERLGVEIKDKIYTHYELEVLRLNLSAYYIDEDMTEEEIEIIKDLDETGVDREEYNKLLDKICNLGLVCTY